jgi:Na+/H+ antiporter NhaD/arsenite permease-like protein
MHYHYHHLSQSIDYNLLFIFGGLFVVVANLEGTGIPKTFWDMIAGDNAFQSSSSMVGICVFVALASQFLGNVAVCQLAKPRIEPLDDDTRRLAWALVSFVSTVAGNLTLTGSAANLIVAEQAMRIDRENVRLTLCVSPSASLCLHHSY